jgi:hypothetical protein
VHNCGPDLDDLKFTPDQDALIQLAKDAKARKTPVSEDVAGILEGWRREVGLPGHGPATHGRSPELGLHINIGPVKHLRIGP